MSGPFASMGEINNSLTADAPSAGWPEKNPQASGSQGHTAGSVSVTSQPAAPGAVTDDGVRTAGSKNGRATSAEAALASNSGRDIGRVSSADARATLDAGRETGRGTSADAGATQHTGREIFTEAGATAPAVRRVYAQKFRGKTVRNRKLLGEMEVGKYGVLAAEAAEKLEDLFLRKLYTSEHSQLGYQPEGKKDMVVSALWLYLAINGGSIGNADGFGGTADDTQPLRVDDIEVPLKTIVQIFGTKTYAYMRYRATEIRDTVEDLFYTIKHTPDPSPGLLEIAELIRVTAVRRDLTSYPQYIAVGSEYAHGTPDHVAAAIIRAGAGVLNSSGNIRDEISNTVRSAQRHQS